MKKLITSVLLVSFYTTALFGSSGVASEWEAMSTHQKMNILTTYKKAEPFNMGYTMASILWQESSAYRYNVSVHDPSCGGFHTSLRSVSNRHDLPHGGFHYNKLCQRLLNDREFAFSEALAELKYWHNVHRGDWFKIWGSYNGGWERNPRYARQIKDKVDFLQNLIEGE